MTDTQDTMQPAEKSSTLLKALRAICDEPSDAFGTLCIAIWRLNEEFGDPPSSVEDLILEVAGCLRSIEFVPNKAQQQ